MSALDDIHAIYDELPEIACKGLCSNSCGPIDMSEVERERIVSLGVQIPRFTSKAARQWADGARLDCPALTLFGSCRVYEDRPLICRLWGVTEAMPCTYGCQPRHLLTDEEAYDFIFRVLEIGGHPDYDTDAQAMRQRFKKFLDDPEIGPVLARFIRGDRAAEAELLELMEKRESNRP